MKTMFKFNLCLIFILGLLSSCSKEQDLTIEDENPESTIQNAPANAPLSSSSIPYSVISVVGDMTTASAGSGTNRRLRFPNMGTFMQTFKALDQQMRDYEEFSVSPFGIPIGGGGIDFEEKDFSNKPITDFLAHYDMGFLYSKIQAEENAFLNIVNVDLSLNPANDYFIGDDALQALLNYNNEVQIGDTIFQFQQNGYSFYVNDNSSSVFNIKTANNALITNIFDDYEVYPCRSNRTNTEYVYSADNKKAIRCRISHVGLVGEIFWCTVKVTNLEKNRRGNWKRVCANSKVRIGGITGIKKDCNHTVRFGTFGKDKKNTKSLSYTHFVEGRISTDWIVGAFSGIVSNDQYGDGLFSYSLVFSR